MAISCQRCTAALLFVLAAFLVLSSRAVVAESADVGTPQAALALWADVRQASRTTLSMPELPTQMVSFETTEGTWMNVDVSPDGETIVFDLLGDLYQLPVEGGDAIPLTTGKAWDQAPRFSLDGEQVYFISDREGQKNLWRLKLADQSLEQITQLETDILGGPNWSQNGGYLLAGVADSTVTGTPVTLHAIDPISGAIAPINPPNGSLLGSKVFSGTESPDGKVVFSAGHAEADNFGFTVMHMYAFDRNSQTRNTLTHAAYHEHKPQLSHDGNLIAYFRQYSEHRTELRILNRITGRDELLVALSNAEYAAVVAREDSRPNYAFTPDDQSVVFWHAGKIHRVNLADKSTETIPFRVEVEREITTRLLPPVSRLNDEAATIRWPHLSPDGKALVFSAFGYAWVMNMLTGEVRRLSNSRDIEYMPVISPDGRSVAYISFASLGEKYGRGRLMITDIEGREHREILADPDADYVMPQWSPDGSMISLMRRTDADRKRGIAKPGGIAKPAFGWTYAAGGAFHEVATPTEPFSFADMFIYAHHLSFDATGERLLFSYPRSMTETVLVTARLDGSAQATLAVGTSEIGGIVPAPDLRKLALTRRDGSVWVVPFDVQNEMTTVSSLVPDARRASRDGGYYVDWNSPDQFTFGLGKKVYRYSLGSSELASLSVTIRHSKFKAARPFAFTGARLVTMSGGTVSESVIGSGTIVVDGTRIAAIGPTAAVEIPADARVVDVAGKTIIPGLLDTHYHGASERSSSASVLPNSELGEPTAVMSGITSAWSPAGMPDDTVPAVADLQKAARILGPRWSYAAAGGVGRPYEMLGDYAAALAAVSQHGELGVKVLKEYNMPTRKQRQWLAAAAYESGLGIVSHLETFDDTMTLIVDGYTGGDHPSLPDSFYKDVHELLKRTGYIITPNLVIVHSVTGGSRDMEYLFCDSVLQKQEQGDLGAQVADSICHFDNAFQVVPYEDHRLSRLAKSFALAASDGVAIGVSAHNTPGHYLYREMWYLWKGGMPIEDVLRATINVNASKLGLQEEVGTLEVGKIADFLILDENPLDDILNTLSTQYTIQGGVIYDADNAERITAEELQRRLAANPAANDDDASMLKTGTNN